MSLHWHDERCGGLTAKGFKIPALRSPSNVGMMLCYFFLDLLYFYLVSDASDDRTCWRLLCKSKFSV